MSPSTHPSQQPSPSRPNLAARLSDSAGQPSAAEELGHKARPQATPPLLEDVLSALRSLEGYQGFMLIAQDDPPLLEERANQRSEEEREELLAQIQRYAHTLKLLSPSRSGLDHSSAPQEIAATYQGETQLIRCLDLEHEIYCILTLEDVWPSIDAARDLLLLHKQTLLRYALREHTQA